MTEPQITFDSMSMWVDEKQGKLYLVYKNQLLRCRSRLRLSVHGFMNFARPLMNI